ncbi:MAG: hypothetical protein ACXADY_22475 [Candidatus Hodarchaeales archaeon]|jgi:hypothetical protein
MEALKHSEWTFGVVFFWFAIYNMSTNGNARLTAIWIIIVFIGSQLPDFLSLFLQKIKLSHEFVRKITHDYAIVIVLWGVMLIFPDYHRQELNFLVTGIAIHYGVDLFSGLEPIYIGGIFFGERTAALYVTAAHRITIGKRIEKWGANYLITQTEKPTPELAWFWIMQLAGTIFCGIGMIFYLI